MVITSASASAPSFRRSLVWGGLSFGVVSLCVFATVAFVERWMYARLGLSGAYLVWTLLFIIPGGAVFNALVVGERRGIKFYLLFGAAFFAYAVGWVSAYFMLSGGAAGEWVGSLAGSVLMGLVFAAGFGVLRNAPMLCVILLVANSAGYFLGSALNDFIGGRAGMLLWGAAYGLCLGAGLGAVLHVAQEARRASALTPLRD
ncbi:MAG TPA: hypothetical protein VGO96_06015 [Pyrinomonadaceae bacterium]|nr:hypothetical protein [Pyrinomonadaceae bacterium]